MEKNCAIEDVIFLRNRSIVWPIFSLCYSLFASSTNIYLVSVVLSIILSYMHKKMKVMVFALKI